MSTFEQFIPAGVERPYVTPHPDGGALVVWEERTGAPERSGYNVEIKAVRIDGDGNLLEIQTIIEGHAPNFGGLSLFSAPIMLPDGGFSIAVTDPSVSGAASSYSFLPDFSSSGQPAEIVGTALLDASDYLTLSSGHTAIVGRDGEVSLVSPDGTGLQYFEDIGNTRQASIVEMGEQGFAVVRHTAGSTVAHLFEFDGNAISLKGTIEFDLPPSFRDPVVINLDGSFVFARSTRDFGDTLENSDDVDSIMVYRADLDGNTTLLDQISFPPGRYAKSDAIVETPDGGFAILIHDRPHGAGGSFTVRRYDETGVFRSEHTVGEGQGSTNNGGYDHQLAVLDDGSLLVTWQTPTEDGGRFGGHLVDLLPPEFHGSDGANALNGSGSDDLIFGHDGNDVVAGLEGSDTLFGDGGNDWLDGGAGTDAIHGGAGNDVLSFMTAAAGVSVALFQAADQVGNDGFGNTETVTGIEWVVGSRFGDAILGDFQDNVLQGMEGDDVFFASLGNDFIVGGRGNDFMQGDDGFDAFAFDVSDFESGVFDTIADFSESATSFDVLFLTGLDMNDLTIVDFGADVFVYTTVGLDTGLVIQNFTAAQLADQMLFG